MVGVVVVSHSKEVAKSAVDFAVYMAPKAKISSAGGLDTDGFGISEKKIKKAIRKVSSDDGVIVIMDMGSAVVVTRDAIDDMKLKCDVRMVDCPLLEGTIVASLEAQMGKDIEHIIKEVNNIKGQPKW